MAFENTKYETGNGSVVFLRTDRELNGLMGTPPTGDPTINIHGLVNGNRSREFGVHPRGVTLSRTVGTGDSESKKYKFLPVLTQNDLDTGTFQIGDSITISTVAWEVSDQVQESLN